MNADENVGTLMTNAFERDIIPPNDLKRVQALRSYKIVYSEKEDSFNELVQLIAQEFNVPVALITFVDKEHVFVKAGVGMDGVEKVDRGVSFCSLAILSDQTTIIENAEKDPCFLKNPLVHGKFGLRFYAASPLITKEGLNIGAVCVMDKKERSITIAEENRLQRFARLVMLEIELKSQVKSKEEEIREKEYQLEEACRLACIGRWDYDVVNRRVAWSDELYHIYGIKKDEVQEDLGSLYISLVHPDDLHQVLHNFQNPETIPQSLTLRFIRPDKKLIYLNQISRHIYDENGTLVRISGISQDVTERMHYEENLRKSEERFSSLVQNSSDLIGIIDAEGNYTYVAESVKRVLGYSADFFYGKNAFDFIHPEDQAKVLECLSAIQMQQYIEVPSFRFIDAAGEWRWIETRIANMLHDPAINGLVLNSRDITAHKQAEEAMIQSEQKFKALVHNSSDIIAILDEEATFTYVSDNITNFLGYKSEELRGVNAFSIIHPDDSEKVRKEFEKVLKKDETAAGISHRLLDKNGEWIWLESKGVNHLADPAVNGIIINAREIGERVKLQQKLDLELESRQLMITKAAISAQENERSQVGLELHDNVNQVLTTVKLYQELCLSGIGNSDQLIRKSMDLLQDSINEIRSLSKRLSAPTLGKIKLHESVKELLDAVNATGKIDISFNAIQIEDVEVDPEAHLALYRILQEHITNILKHAKALKVEVLLLRQYDNILLHVTDDGVGFDPSKKSKGIGITNMKTRAESLKGRICLFSAPGQGCKLIVQLPIGSYVNT